MSKKKVCMVVFTTKDEPNISPKLEILHVPYAKSKTSKLSLNFGFNALLVSFLACTFLMPVLFAGSSLECLLHALLSTSSIPLLVGHFPFVDKEVCL